MRLLIDANLSFRVAEALSEAGHDAVHVRDVMRVNAPATAIFGHAAGDDRIVVSSACSQRPTTGSGSGCRFFHRRSPEETPHWGLIFDVRATGGAVLTSSNSSSSSPSCQRDTYPSWLLPGSTGF